MAIKLNLVVFSFIVAVSLVQISQAQTSHVVGDSIGWTIPTGGSTDYATWAAAQTFAVGDFLIFNYTTGAHDVAAVTKTAFDGCSSTNPISTETTGPTNLTLNSTGEHYFICTFGNHCSQGQKLAVNVSSSNTSSPSPPGTTTSPPPPAASSSPPLALAALPITLLSILVAFCVHR